MKKTRSRDYYEILEVHPSASPEVIEKAYKALSMKYHPDKQPSEKKRWATRRMQELNEAYRVLSDPLKRRVYDSKLARSQKTQEMLRIFWENGLIGLVKYWLESEKFLD
ncbi:MAG: DnaJ domain-containing protein [Actinomycetota bacterium]|nr:DnaJ domain-containing protein [Actinomycetota bacterium]MDI6822462.1 DnaJ domain-containing protein [Actinomycetota bacterium]